jgi:hypothetical protein
MSSVGELRMRVSEHPQIRLVNQRRGLQGVVRPLLVEMLLGDPVKLLVDPRHQLVRGGSVAGAGALQ